MTKPCPYDSRKAEEVVAEARRWLGVPFKFCGRGREGVDCVGLLFGIADSLAIPYCDPIVSGRYPDGLSDRTKAMLGAFRPIDGDVPLLGDILVFAHPGRCEPAHLALLSGCGAPERMIHVGRHTRVVREEVYSDFWRDLVVAICRLDYHA